MSEEFISVQPGDVKIKNAVILNSTGAGANITRLVMQVNIFEDIMSPFVSGRVIISDAISISEMLPFKGEELIMLEFETPGFDEQYYKRSGVYILYKMAERVNAQLKNVMYELSFMSLDAARDMNLHFQKTFRGEVHKTVEKILSDKTYLATNKDLLIEEAGNHYIHTSNFWTPQKNVMHLAENVVNKSGNPSFLFFEQTDGFVFASLDKLYSHGAITTFVRDRQVRQDAQSNPSDPQSRNLAVEYSKILDMSVGNLYDYIDRARSGMYGSTLYYFDVETKKLHYSTKDGYRDFADGRMRLNPHLPVSVEETLSGKGRDQSSPFLPTSAMFFEVNQRSSYNGSPMMPIEFNQQRATLLGQAMFNKISIQVFGRFDYTVGKTVDVIIYSDKETFEGEDPKESYDKVLSGRYLITAINHEITQVNHMCNIELAKDSYLFKLDENIREATE